MRNLIVLLTCARICAALGYEFPFSFLGDCLCVEHPPYAIVPFVSHVPPKKKEKEYHEDERPRVQYELDE